MREACTLALAWVALQTAAGCGPSKDDPVDPPPVVTDGGGAVGAVIDARGPRPLYTPAPARALGLPADQEAEFYSLPEGSGLFPLGWAQNMDDKDTHQPFMQHLERFGFVMRDGQPIGLTEEEIRYGVISIKLLGVNCAACHVGELEVDGQRLRIDGAPNQFDIERFYVGLEQSAQATLESHDPRRIWRMLFGGSTTLASITSDPALAPKLSAVSAALADADQLRSDGPEGARIVAQLDREIASASDAFDAELGRARDKRAFVMAALRETAVGRATARAGRVRLGDLDLTAMRGALGASTSSRIRDLLDNANALLTAVTELRSRVRRLKARIAFLRAVTGRDRALSTPDTPPMGGRVDAFGFARNFLFGPTYGYSPNLAPIAYPHLWGMGKRWLLHWNDNTNSVMARNIGQALGVGAVVDQKSWESSVVLPNLHRLETLATAIPAPRWADAAPLLPAPDPALVAQGEKLYQQQCASCHDWVETDARGFEHYKEIPLAELGTDPNQAMAFARPLASDLEFYQGLDRALTAVETTYVRLSQRTKAPISPEMVKEWHGGREPIEWRQPLAYAARPLTGVWATAPYLHNNSVPTLEQLLRAPADRPKTFVVGNRAYDPVEVGYVWRQVVGDPDQARNARTFDTALPGNSNAGHDFFRGTDAERRALVEYLKTR